ncbi:MAG: TlpA family protein disulfide reductase [Candidatus Omnitrophica bacterium]|nr:TlpA family protein disulfide reductase [Candidatus Omnitrophota bacterium]
MKLLKGISLVIFMLSMSCALANCARAQQEMVGMAAPDFRLQDIQGNTVTLSSYKNKEPVLLFFWTTWCAHCESEVGLLNEKYAGLTGEGLEVLSINVGESEGLVRDFIRGRYLAYRILLDQNENVARSYGVTGVPTYILINRKGSIIFQDSYFPQEQYKDSLAK